MRQLVTVIVVLACGALALNAARADAVPACLPSTEKLALETTSARFNGQAGEPVSAGSRLYATDAGVQFYVGQFAELDAVAMTDSMECPPALDELRVKITDPWTGEQLTIGVKENP